MNRLAGSSSPYLLQHADNPVDWWPWGDEAFAEARRRDVPVLLSVGYASCHWCHVMAHESFADEATAAQVNADFVAIKVDREERPDVDAVHMGAVLALTGQGGWPMTAFLTPDGAPFHAGTYFPPVPVGATPSFRQVLTAVTATWRERREDVDRQAAALVAHLRAGAAQDGAPFGAPEPGAGADAPALVNVPSTAPLAPTPEDLAAAVDILAEELDGLHGGFGGAPKFPPSMTLVQLLRHHDRTGDERALGMVTRTASAMASGGIYDQLGGGFARYAVDATWTVPHFEKMLYDNAQLLAVYAQLWRATGEPWARRVALETAGFLERDLLAGGGFASSLDADTDGVEGAFYVWTPTQLEEALGPDDAPWAARVCGVTGAGTFEHGTSVLRLHPATVRQVPAPGAPAMTGLTGTPGPGDDDAAHDDARHADAAAAPADDDGARWVRVRERLLAARSSRTPPARDDKVVAGWNGLAIGALAEAGRILDAPHLVALAERVADHVVRVHLLEDGLRRTSLGGVAGDAPGALEDHALLADGLLVLFSATGDTRWFRTAQLLLDTATTLFVDDTGIYDAPATATGPALFLRPGDPGDNASPSGRSALAGALLRLGALGDVRHRPTVERALAPYRTLARRVPRFAGWGLAVAEALADGPREVAILGEGPDGALARAAWASRAPGLVVATSGTAGAGTPADRSREGARAGARGGAGEGDELVVPLLADRTAKGGRPTAYVCRGTTCSLPVTDAAALTALLADAH